MYQLPKDIYNKSREGNRFPFKYMIKNTEKTVPTRNSANESRKLNDTEWKYSVQEKKMAATNLRIMIVYLENN